MRAKLLRIGIRLVGPVLLVVVLWRLTNLDALLAVLGEADWAVLLFAATLNAANIHLKVMRWQVLLAIRGFRYPTAAGWKAILPAMYLGMATPGRVGDVLRIQYMRHDADVPYAEGLAIIVMDRFCDLYVLLCFVVAAVTHFAHVLRGDLGLVTWAGVALTALAPAVFLVRGLVDPVLERIYRKVARQRSEDGARRFLEALRGQLRPRLVVTVPLTVGAFLVQYLQGYIAAGALGIDIGFVDVMFVLAITSLLSLLPISVSGVGVRELFLALVFPALALTQDQGVAFGLVMFAVVYVATMCAGLVAWMISPPPLRSSEESEPPDE